MLPAQLGSNPQPPNHQSDAHPTEPRLGWSWSDAIFKSFLLRPASLNTWVNTYERLNEALNKSTFRKWSSGNYVNRSNELLLIKYAYNTSFDGSVLLCKYFTFIYFCKHIWEAMWEEVPYDWLTVLGFNDTSTLVGHFVSWSTLWLNAPCDIFPCYSFFCWTHNPCHA